MSVHLIAMYELPGVCPMGVGEMWHRLFAKCILKVTGSEATRACKDDQLCVVLKAVVNMAVEGVQSIWEANWTNENWGFNLLTQGTCSEILIEFECCGWSAIYGRLDLIVFKILSSPLLSCTENGDGTANIIHSKEGCDTGRPTGYGFLQDWNFSYDQTP